MEAEKRFEIKYIYNKPEERKEKRVSPRNRMNHEHRPVVKGR